MEGPGVARNYTAHLFSMQAKCYVGDVAETRGRTTMPQQPLCGIHAAERQKVRLKFLYVAAFPWPTCSHADASPAVFPRQAQGLLPARAGSPLAGQDAHLLDDTQSFMETSHPPIPFDPQGLVALIYLSAFVLPHDSLSQRLSEPQPTRGSGSPKKWQSVTPAMAAGLTDHVWTMEELLSYRVPPAFRDRLDQQATTNTS